MALARRTPLKQGAPLKRGAPLGHRDGLKRAGLKRGAGLAAGSRLANRSAKMAALYVQRRPLVARILTDRRYCQAGLAGCTGHSTEVHEVLSRGRGGSILDEANCVALCHGCHRWITEHPVEAEALGWSVHSWDREQGACAVSPDDLR